MSKSENQLSDRRIKYWINRFDRACRDMAFIGSMRPSDHPYIRDEYNRVKEKLINMLKGTSHGK